MFAGKLFFGSQNGTVYSVRARERPAVSTPVSWEEVTSCRAERDPERLTFDTDQVLARFEEQGDLFAPLLSVKPAGSVPNLVVNVLVPVPPAVLMVWV